MWKPAIWKLMVAMVTSKMMDAYNWQIKMSTENEEIATQSVSPLEQILLSKLWKNLMRIGVSSLAPYVNCTFNIPLGFHLEENKGFWRNKSHCVSWVQALSDKVKNKSEWYRRVSPSSSLKAGVPVKAVFWLGIMVLMRISRLLLKQSRISMLKTYIYVLGRLWIFWWFLGVFGDKKFFLKGLVKLMEIGNFEDLVLF